MMYTCDRCGEEENSALGLYWLRVGLPKLCSLCGYGKWHGKWPRKNPAPPAPEATE